MVGTLIIYKVDLSLLESQRKVLNTIEHMSLTPEQSEALDGVVGMLDIWSDERARECEERHTIERIAKRGSKSWK